MPASPVTMPEGHFVAMHSSLAIIQDLGHGYADDFCAKRTRGAEKFQDSFCAPPDGPCKSLSPADFVVASSAVTISDWRQLGVCAASHAKIAGASLGDPSRGPSDADEGFHAFSNVGAAAPDARKKRLTETSAAEDVCDRMAALRSDSPPKKARMSKSVRFGGVSAVRFVAWRFGDEDLEDPNFPDAAEATKLGDGPAIEAECVSKMLVELFKTRDPSIVTQTLQVICEKGTLKTMHEFISRVNSLLQRLRASGKVSLLPSCVSLRRQSLPVLVWLLDCAHRAEAFMAAPTGWTASSDACGAVVIARPAGCDMLALSTAEVV